MSFLKNTYEQILNQWERSAVAQRVMFSAITAIAVIAVISIGWWSSRPQYIPFAENLSPSRMAELKTALDAKGIANKMNFSGSGILVPSARWNDAQIAAGDEFANAFPSDNVASSTIIGDPTESANRILKTKEQSLEASLMRFKAIEHADVQIAAPEWSPFVSERNPTTASVVLGIRASNVFTADHAATVVAMVARSVEGLAPSNVTVTSLDGRTLYGGSTADVTIERNHDYRTRLEADLAAKAQIILTEMLGENKSIVRVTADVDFTETTREDVVFDPDSKVKTSEEIENSKTTTITSVPTGVAGTGSNVNPANVASTASPALQDKESTKTEYQNGSTTDTVRIAPGVINRLTIAAIIELPDSTASADGTPAAPAIDETRIKAVIQNAVGFDSTRGDQIEVLVAPLVGVQLTEIPIVPGQNWEWLTTLVANASLGIAAIVALLLGTKVVKKMEPISTPGVTAEPARDRLLSELSEQAKQNPELISNILSAWLNNEEETSETSSAADSPNLKVVRSAA